VLVFPEGSRTLDGNIGEAAPGIGLVAVKSGAPIQPVRISGARDALPRGSGRISFARITVSVGPPIILSPEELKSATKDDYDRIAKRIMSAIEALEPPVAR
jgi:1-acyl-sn-glycerol-3-phosphate acyltransferase